LLVFWKSTDSTSLDSIPLLNKLHKRRGVEVIAITPEDKNTAGGTVRGKGMEFTVGYGGELDKKYKVSSYPRVFMIDTRGILVWRGHPGELEDRLSEQMRKTPPVGADAATLRNRYNKAKALFDQREYGRAYTLAKEVADVMEESESLGEAARSLMTELEKQAATLLEEAKQARQTGDFEKACRLIAVLTVRFAGADVATEAEDEAARLRSDRKSKNLCRKAIENAKGELRNDEAADLEASKKYPEALSSYRSVAEKFTGTEAAKTAKSAIQRIKSDPSIQAHIRKWYDDEQADRWLDLADRFAKVEMFDMAREFYAKVVESHPRSPAATKARKRVKKLPSADGDQP
jgi:tetratricopeptide (TPR) repeat protein